MTPLSSSSPNQPALQPTIRETSLPPPEEKEAAELLETEETKQAKLAWFARIYTVTYEKQADTLYTEGQLEQAASLYDQVFMLSQASDPHSCERCLYQAATIYQKLDQKENALSRFIKLAAIFIEHENIEKAQELIRQHILPSHLCPLNSAILFNNTAFYFLEKDRQEEAFYYFQKAEERVEILKTHTQDTDFLKLRFNIAKGQAAILIHSGCLQEALVKKKELLAILKNLPETVLPPINEAALRREIGLLLLDLSNYQEALQFFEESLQLERKSHPEGHPDIGQSLMCIGNALELLGRTEDAFASFQEGLTVARKFSMANRHLLNSLMIIANFMRGKEASQAREMYREALEMAQSLDFSKEEFYVRLKIGDMLREHNCSEARATYQEALRLLDTAKNNLTGLERVIYYGLFFTRLVMVNTSLNLMEEAKDIDMQLAYFAKGIFLCAGNETIFQCESLYNEFVRSYKEAMEVSLSKLSESNLNPIEKYSKLIDSKEPKISDKIYPFIIHYFRSSGNLYKAQGAFRTAVQYLEIALKLCKDRKSEEAAECLESLASAYLEAGQLQKAHDHINQAVNLRKRAPDSLEFASSLNVYGAILQEMALFKEAEEQYKKALGIGLRVDKSHFLVGSFWDNLGQLHQEIGRFDEALQCYTQALRIAGPNPNSYNRLGRLCIDLDQQKEAKKHFQKALEMLRHMSFTALLKTQNTRENYALCLASLGKSHEALNILKEVLLVKEKEFDDHQNISTASTLMHLGLYNERIGQYETALEHYRRSYQIQLHILGEDHPLVASAGEYLGSCLVKQGGREEGLQMLKNSLKIRKKVFGNTHPTVAVSYDKLGFYWSSANQYKNALRNYKSAYAIRKNAYPSDHSLITLSESHIETCQYASQPPETTGLLLNKEGFEQLLEYAKEYIRQQKDVLTLEKNPSGFVRIRLPCPEHLKEQVEMIRLHYWPPELHIDVVEALHNHPSYFESMIVKGGYTHALYKGVKESSAHTSPFVTHRILKRKSSDMRNIFCVEETHLEFIKDEEVGAGSILGFPRELIHQVKKSHAGTLSLNCVFKSRKRGCFEVFLPLDSPQDPQIERDSLMQDESNAILSQIKEILGI